MACRTVHGFRSKPKPTHGKVDAKYVEPSQKDVDNLLVTVSFSLDEETIQQICSNPDPETVQTTCRSERVDDVS